MRILLTNDDGIAAPGLAALYRAIADLGDIHVIAPAAVQSATSHAVTFHRPIGTRRQTVRDDAGNPLFEGTAVEGRPADCVKLALHHLVPKPIDLVISGMNAGANVGINTFYSGTVGAAREAAICSIPALAVSLHIAKRDAIDWPRAAALARTVIDRIVSQPLEPQVMLNLNLPVLDDGAQPRGLRVVPISTSPIVEEYSFTDSAQGDRHFMASEIFNFRHQHPDTDVEALFAGYMTLTPLLIDLTCPRSVQQWAKHLAGKTTPDKV
ncbi:MAG: 5'/3'-nucleotidase SurE [Phycisphaeraceae bacterium]